MKHALRLFAVLFVLGIIPSVRGETAKYDHVHLAVADQAAAVEWYAKYMGGEKVAGPNRVAFGTTLIIFMKGREGFEGSVGSSVDHIGFSFTDLAAKMTEFEEAGIKILGQVRDVRGLFKFAFVEDPWGTKLEVMEDSDTLGFHHIHLRGENPGEILDWYQKAFGGEKTRYKGMLDALRYGDVWLMAQDSRGAEIAGTRGRSIDHLGWGMADMDIGAAELKEKGVKFTLEPRPFRNPEIAIKIAFVEGPGGVRIELVQRPAP